MCLSNAFGRGRSLPDALGSGERSADRCDACVWEAWIAHPAVGISRPHRLHAASLELIDFVVLRDASCHQTLVGTLVALSAGFSRLLRAGGLQLLSVHFLDFMLAAASPLHRLRGLISSAGAASSGAL